MSKGQLFSPGKLMLTAEYFAMDGALVLAVPTKSGQAFFYEEHSAQENILIWKAYHQNQLWLEAIINYSDWKIVSTNDTEATEFVVKVLKNIQLYSKKRLQNGYNVSIKTNLQFPPNYGWGSSSTLMNNLAEWASLDPFFLNNISLGGSGYDIAIAQSKSAILFQNLPNIQYEKVNFSPSFKSKLLFIHLNKKQNSREGIALYKAQKKSQILIDEISNLTNEIVKCKEFDCFSELMILHEQKISNFIKKPTIKSTDFQDCPQFVKSLGAWGGDFILTAEFDGFEAYFQDKGLHTIFHWEDIIL